MTIRRFVAASLLAATALVAATPASAQRVTRIVAFGDSYADTGNLFRIIGLNPVSTTVYTTGRFSGGTNYIDTLSTLLNAPQVNYAIGGATTGSANVTVPAPLGYSTQVGSFLAGGGTLFPAGPATFGPNDLLAISVGGNDARAYQQSGGTVAGATAAANVAVANFTANTNALVAAGARNISYIALDASTAPEVAGNLPAQAVRGAFSSTFNAGIKAPLAGYAANGAIVNYLDVGLVGARITATPAAYGITNLVCPAFPNPTCVVNASGYLFYGDQLHLTSDGFRIVAKYIAAQMEAPLTLQATSDLALDTARQFGRTMMTRMDAGSPRDGELLSGVRLFALGDTFSRTADATFTSDQIKTTSVGATLGLEAGFSGGTAGIAANYSKPKAKVGAGVADTRSRSYQIGAFAGFGLAGGFAQGYLGYGKDKHRISRMGVIDAMSAKPSGSHVLAGAKAGYLMGLGGLRAGPVVALDYAKAKVDGYTETGDAALTLNVNSQRFSSLRGSAGLELRGDMDLGGMHFRPFAALLAEKDFKGDGRTVYYAQTSAPTIVNHFAFENASKKTYGRLNLGFGAGISSALSVDAGVSGTFGKKQGNETSGQIGFNVGF
ncbi:autotransporter domain-containing protein [Sphingomonas sp. RB1R13]|uniref:autotransporter domain-containing protein n=1 Tax=Sphingomonas sp. RB1R13 TaxID=3096159 RepID=UPI002FC6653C